MMQILTPEWLVTIDPADTVSTDVSVLVDGERIAAIDTTRDLLDRHPAAEHVAMPGHVLMPGLVNAHTHLAMTMFRGLADDRDLQQFLDRLVPAEAAVLDATRVRTATLAASVECLRGGVTTALDMYFFPDAVLEAGHAAGMRIVTGPTFVGGPGPEGLERDARLRWAEEWLGARPARPGWRPVVAPHSTYLVGPDELTVLRELAERHDAIFHLHAAENLGEIETVLDRHSRRPVELLDSLGLLGPRTVLAHAVVLDDDELARISETGTAVAHCPASNLKLASGVARVPELVGAGATVALGTDGAASSNDLDMFMAMRLAALLHKGVSADATVLPASRVLRLATMGGATALGLDGSIGSIEVGKLADLIAVDLRGVHTQPVYDPRSALVYSAGRADVRHVWTDGRRVVEDGEPTRVDTTEVTDALTRLRDAVLAAAGP